MKVKLKKLFLDLSPVLGYIISLGLYYLLGIIWLYIPIFIFIKAWLVFPYFAGIMWNGKKLYNYLRNPARYDRISLAIRIMLGPYFNFLGFINYFVTAHKIYMLAVNEEDPMLRIHEFWEYIERPFKRAKDLL